MSSEFTPASELSEAPAPPPPAQESSATPVEVEATTTEAPPVGEGQEVENKPTSEAADEPSVAASDEPEETPKVRAQARKVFMEVQKMGGEPAFEAAKSIYDTFFRKSPQDFIGEIGKYGAKFYPVRDHLLAVSVRDYPDAMVEMLRQLHPDLEIQVGKKGVTQAPPADTADPIAIARQVLEDPLASDYERALARHAIASEEKLGRLPELEKDVSTFKEFQTTQQQQRVQAEQTKYADELLESAVDKTYKESGLEGSPISLEQFRELVIAAHGKDPEANARFEEAMNAISKGDMRTALLLKESILRDGEAIAFRYAKSFSTAHAQRLASTAQQLTKGSPTVVPPGQPPGPVSTVAPPFDEADYAASLKDIKARTA